MIIEKPLWVQHKQENGKLATIYSVDIHPDGTRIATGAGDSVARIWSMKPIIDKEAEKENNMFPKQLAVCQGGHTRAITCVRWSSNGVFLACGSDDTNVTIWMRQQTQQATPVIESNGETTTTSSENDKSNTNEKKTDDNTNGEKSDNSNKSKSAKKAVVKEEWTRLLTCMGHSSDVQDLAWAPDDSKLASCSVDNTILVWAINNTTIGRFVLHQPLAKLTGHEGWVKGLAWDPVGKYLASVGSDNVMNIWRTTDWKCEGKVTKPFNSGKRSSGNVVRRISWSPDGRNICGTLAFKNSAHCAVIIDRNTWTDGCELVGHNVPVIASRFNSRILLKKNKKKKKKLKVARKSLQKNAVTCCAIGDFEGTISVWMTSAEKPIVVLKKALNSAITDLAWSIKDGKTLVASSLSGHILVVRFQGDEIGKVVSLEDHAYLLRQLYGDTNYDLGDAMLVENTVQLAFEGANDSQGSNSNSQNSHNNPFGFGSGNSANLNPDQPTMTYDEATAYMRKEKGKVQSSSTEGIVLQSFKSTNSPVRKMQKVSKKNGKKRIRPVLITRPMGNNNNKSGSGNSLNPLDSNNSGKVTTITELMKSVSAKSNRSKSSSRMDDDDDDDDDDGKSGTSSSAKKRPKSKTFAVPSRKRNRSLNGGASKRSKQDKSSSNNNNAQINGINNNNNMMNGSNNPNGLNLNQNLNMMMMMNRQLMMNAYQLEAPARRLTYATVIGYRFIDNGNNSNTNNIMNGLALVNTATGTNGNARRSKILSLSYRVVAPGDSVSISSNSAASTVTTAAASTVPTTTTTTTTTADTTPPSSNGVSGTSGNGNANTNAAKEDLGVEFDCLSNTILTLSCGGDVCWRDQIRGRGSLLCGNDRFSCIAMTTGEVLIYTNAGRRKCAPIILPNPLAFLECVSGNNNRISTLLGDSGSSGGGANSRTNNNNSSNFILGISCDSEMRIWDASSARLLVHDRNGLGRLIGMVASQLRSKLIHTARKEDGNEAAGNDILVNAKINNVSLKHGINRPTPLVTIVATATNNNDSRLAQVFAYNYSMQSWSPVGNDHFVRSNFFSPLSYGNVIDSVGTLNSVQTACAGISTYEVMRSAAGTSGDGVLTLDTQWIETRAHLEHQLACCLLLESPSEYKSWLNSYAKFLARSGSPESIERLKELCSELLGPAVPLPGWRTHILGLSRHHLLKDVLKEMSTNRVLQRLVNEYSEAIPNGI